MDGLSNTNSVQQLREIFSAVEAARADGGKGGSALNGQVRSFAHRIALHKSTACLSNSCIRHSKMYIFEVLSICAIRSARLPTQCQSRVESQQQLSQQGLLSIRGSSGHQAPQAFQATQQS